MDSGEIDKRIAEKVMGWSFDIGYYFSDTESMDKWCQAKDWQPSTNIAHAFEVVGKFLSEKRGDFTWEFDLSIFEGMSDATFGKHYERGKGKDTCWDAQNKETPMAICLAALEAVKGEQLVTDRLINGGTQ